MDGKGCFPVYRPNAVARKGGKIAGDARKKLEAQTGRSVILSEKASDYLPPTDRIQDLPEDAED